MLILNLLRVYPEKQIQGELQLCSARLQNKGNLQRQKHQGHIVNSRAGIQHQAPMIAEITSVIASVHAC